MRTLVLDIETKPTKAHLDLKFAEWCAADHHKTREKIERQAMAGSLSPLTGFVWGWCGLSVRHNSYEVFEMMPLSSFGDEGSESGTLDDVRTALEACDRIIAYNGVQFDIPFLKFRIIHKHGRAPGPLFSHKVKPWDRKLEDPFDDLPYSWKRGTKPQGDAGSFKLRNVARFLGLEGPPETDFVEAWIANDIDAVRNKCAEDVLQLFEVSKRLGYFGAIQ